MSAKRKPSKRSQARRDPSVEPQAPDPKLAVARHAGDQWKLVHPRCAREREDDLAEVRQMLEAGEAEVAIDELRWLLEDCGAFVEAHRLLGEIAMTEGDLSLARGHFGYGFQLGRAAVANIQGTLPYALPENAALHESAKGLAWCLHELGRDKLALEVVEQALAWDPDDPLGIRPWLEQFKAET